MSEGGGGGGEALPRSRVSAEQLELLVSFMEEHAEFAAGRQSVYSRFSASKLWRLLAERLNGAAHYSGGARKSPDKWCRYWADIKYKARKKSAAGGALGELSNVEERLRDILRAGGGGVAGGKGGAPTGGGRLAGAGGTGGGGGGVTGGGGVGGGESDEERKPLDDEWSDQEGEGGAGGAGARLGADELLAEAAMRTALAAEKQAEAVAQGVELLRELVCVVRERLPPAPGPGPGPGNGPPSAPAPAPAPLHHDHHDHHMQHHHHRL